MVQSTRKDFFISYTSTDRTWAEWIAWQLEDAGYLTVLQVWDFRPGSNFVLEMDRATQEAERTIAILSPEYLNGTYTKAEWAAAFRRDPTGEQGLLLPVHVRECKHQLIGLLGSIIYLDLVGLDDMIAARNTLLAGVRRDRAKPTTPPSFPMGIQHSVSKQPRFPGAFPRAWTVPYQRNPFFTGREDTLKDLYEMLRIGKTVALVQPRALSGLGGIGKTQSAVEYAYRYYSDYPEAFLWVRAETRETLISDFVSIANALDLPEKDEQDQNRVVGAVKRWFKDHADWLLIFDNVDDLAMVKNFIPSARRGHILLTTRIQALGDIAQGIEMEKMEPEEGALFLLRRANIIGPDALLEAASESDGALAIDISKVMDGLPLALDQAGAYIEETRCSLSDYLNFYQKRRRDFLKRRGPPNSDHPESVVTTWSLSFEKVNQADPASAELLRFCAFLSPDAIPEEIITEGASELGPLLQSVAADLPRLNEAIRILLRFSFIRRSRDDKTLGIHRLVQAVLIDNMNKRLQQKWAERAVRVINQAFPYVDFKVWSVCQRLLPQVQICSIMIEQRKIYTPEAALLLSQAGCYLYDRTQYVEAEIFHKQALTIREKILGSKHTDIAASLTNLAMVYNAQEKYTQVEPFLKRALTIWEQASGPEARLVGTVLNDLAVFYANQGESDKAEQLYQRVLTIRKKLLGSEHPEVALTLYNMANNCLNQYNYKQAEQLLTQTLDIRLKALGLEHPDTVASLNGLALVYSEQGKYTEAESTYQQVLKIGEQVLGLEHLDMVLYLNNLAKLYCEIGKYAQAEPLYRRALAIGEKLGLNHSDRAKSLDGLTQLYLKQGKYNEAEHFAMRSLSFQMQVLGPSHVETATSLNNLGFLHYIQDRYAEAEPFYQKALMIQEQVLGSEHPSTITSINNLAALYRDWGRYAEAETLYQRGLAICQKMQGAENLEIAFLLNGLAKVYHAQCKYFQAEQYCKRALAIREQALESDHVDIAHSLLTLAFIYYAQENYAQAEPLFTRVLMIREHVSGLQHPEVATILEHYANLLRRMNHESQAKELEARARSIRASQENSSING